MNKEDAFVFTGIPPSEEGLRASGEEDVSSPDLQVEQRRDLADGPVTPEEEGEDARYEVEAVLRWKRSTGRARKGRKTAPIWY